MWISSWGGLPVTNFRSIRFQQSIFNSVIRSTLLSTGAFNWIKIHLIWKRQFAFPVGSKRILLSSSMIWNLLQYIFSFYNDFHFWLSIWTHWLCVTLISYRLYNFLDWLCNSLYLCAHIHEFLHWYAIKPVVELDDGKILSLL